MYEDEILDNLDLMAASIQLVQSRFAKVMTASDFVDSAEGVVLLDAIVMRLQIIGELVKKIQKVAPLYLSDYTDIEWKKIGKFRDLVSHHYEQVDHEIVYDICKMHIQKLNDTIQKMQKAFRERSNTH
jgi:uncharacterized protein with HEPN domain